MTNKVKEEVNRIQNIENFMRNKSSQKKKCNQDSKPDRNLKYKKIVKDSTPGTKKPQILMNKRKLNHEKQPNSTTNRN